MSGSTSPEPTSRPRASVDAEFVPIGELARRYAAEPFTTLAELPAVDPFGSDQEYEAFLADLYASRRSDS